MQKKLYQQIIFYSECIFIDRVFSENSGYNVILSFIMLCAAANKLVIPKGMFY